MERDGQVERDTAVVPYGMNHDMPRSYSTSHATGGYNYNTNNLMMGKDLQMKKMKSSQGLGKSWSLNDPELKRKKRVAGYKVYAVEGKVKGSVRKGFRWIKDIVYGWR